MSRLLSRIVSLALLLLPAGCFISKPLTRSETRDLRKDIWNGELNPNPIAQWLEWETELTAGDWQQQSRTSKMPLVMAPAKRVARGFIDYETLSHSSLLRKRSYEAILGHFFQRGAVKYPIHPYNTDPMVPFFDLLQDQGVGQVKYLEVHNTSSRSLVVWHQSKSTSPDILFGIKSPTNYPFGPKRREQPEKVDVHLDIFLVPLRAKIIYWMEARYRQAKWIRPLVDFGYIREREDERGNSFEPPETWTMAQRKAGVLPQNGALIRDLSPLQNGNYFFPAHLVPTHSKRIYEISRAGVREDGQTKIGLDEFWMRAYSDAMGRAAAEAVLRWGIIPNMGPQNFLLEFRKLENPQGNEQIEPTGVVYWRDLGDSGVVRPLVPEYGDPLVDELNSQADRKAAYLQSDRISRQFIWGGAGVCQGINHQWNFNNNGHLLNPIFTANKILKFADVLYKRCVDSFLHHLRVTLSDNTFPSVRTDEPYSNLSLPSVYDNGFNIKVWQWRERNRRE